MLRYPLIHPPLLAVLAESGHGSRILIADANYAHRTNTNPNAPVIHLNLRPGLLTVDEILSAITGATPVESAAMMRPDDGSAPPLHPDYQHLLGAEIPLTALDRPDFYSACRSHELAATIATGDQRHYANILLTIGALPPT